MSVAVDAGTGTGAVATVDAAAADLLLVAANAAISMPTFRRRIRSKGW